MADDSDRDGDPWTTLLEYAFGYDPNLPEPGAGPSFALIGGEMRLTYDRNPDATDLRFEVQTTTDLSDPASGISVGVDQGAGNLTQASVSVDPSTDPAKFLPLVVARP